MLFCSSFHSYIFLFFFVFFFFFSSRRRHTRFKCDWSSDVCSSDLFICIRVILLILLCLSIERGTFALILISHFAHVLSCKIGRASCRERVYIFVVVVLFI